MSTLPPTPTSDSKSTNPYINKPIQLIVHDGQNNQKINVGYVNEVQTNINNELIDIGKIFAFDTQQIQKIEISPAGQETHCGNKVAVYVTFCLSNNQTIKVIYKPRTIVPDMLLEETRKGIDGSHIPRKMLSKGAHGYDEYLDAKPLQITNYDYAYDYFKHSAHSANRALFQAMQYLEIEDAHPENFLIDKNGKLYFIDAECYRTHISYGIDEIFNNQFDRDQTDDILTGQLTGYIEPISPLSETQQNPLKKYKDQLATIPTRLAFCGTTEYQKRLALALGGVLFRKEGRPPMKYTPQIPELRAGDPEMARAHKESFEKYHAVQFLSFLYKNDFFEWSAEQEKPLFYEQVEEKEKPLSYEQVEEKLKILIGQSGITCLNAELEQCTGHEIPFFRFDFTRNEVSCGHTGHVFSVKRQGVK